MNILEQTGGGSDPAQPMSQVEDSATDDTDNASAHAIHFAVNNTSRSSPDLRMG